MEIIKKIQEMQLEMTRWRQNLHATPELAFEERGTARFLSRQLQTSGIEEVYPFGKTGIVGVLHGRGGPASRTGGKTIMLRAEMDALQGDEKSGALYTSRNEGAHHGCGHDGHMAMLLGAAKHLAQNPNFTGTVYFVFQPAEEPGSGAAEMLREGLLKKFPADEVYGLHNAPWLPLGTMASAAGNMLAGSEEFSITFNGTGGHMHQPGDTTNLIGAMAEAIAALNDMAEKEIPESETAVLKVSAARSSTQSADTLPESIRLKGNIRSHDPELLDRLKLGLQQIVEDAAVKYGASASVEFRNAFLPLANSPAETDVAVEAAREIVGDSKVVPSSPLLNVDDFSRYLQEKPGNFMTLGTGRTDGKETSQLHSPKYDFNDAALTIGASYWVRLVEKALSPARGKTQAAPDAPKP